MNESLHEGVGLPSGAHQWRRGRLRFFFLSSFFFSSLFNPPKRGKIRPFLGRLFFFRPFMHAGGCTQEKKKRSSTKKHRRFKKKCRLRHRTPLTVRAMIRTFTYGTKKVVRVLSACVICTLPQLGIISFFIRFVLYCFFRSSYFSGGVFICCALVPGTLALDLPTLILWRLVFLCLTVWPQNSCISRMKNQEGHWRHCWCRWVERTV